MNTRTLGAWNRGGWQPDKRTSFALSLCALSVLISLFVGLLSSRMVVPLSDATDGLRESLTFAAPLPRVPAVRLPPPVHAPVHTSTLLTPLPALLVPIAPLLDTDLHDYMDESTAVRLRDKVTQTELARALQAPASTPALRDNRGFSSVYGQKIVRFGDHCAEVHRVQASSSPTNHVDIAMIVPCPGSYTKTMGDDLLDWADKHRPPP